jgi:hypothetical protein
MMVQVYRYADAEPEGNGIDCDIANVGFRIEGVPDDPAFQRRFEPFGFMTGDPFGDGCAIYDLIGAPGDLLLGAIWLYVASPLPSQVWSIQAHRHIPGTTTPVAQFESAPGVWKPEASLALNVASANPNCAACIPIPALQCPFAIEPGTWSGVKSIYR